MDIVTTLEQLLSTPEAIIKWAEPWPGKRENGERCDCGVVLSASVSDCINMQRAAGSLPNATPLDLLGDFIAVHWAWPAADEDAKS